MQWRIFLLGFFLLAGELRAGNALEHARRAQALLGPGVWSQVIRVENIAVSSVYPRVLHALVFELAGLLWFYTDTDGTQSISLRAGRLVEEKADFGPLLRDIEPGFKRWSVVPDATGAVESERGTLPNGCFIASVAALRQRLAQGGTAGHARLLSYYVDTPAGLRGHTVLTCETRGQLEVIDPERPKRPRFFPGTLAADALGLARTMAGGRVSQARWVPVEFPAAKIPLYAAGGPAAGRDPGAVPAP